MLSGSLTPANFTGCISQQINLRTALPCCRNSDHIFRADITYNLRHLRLAARARHSGNKGCTHEEGGTRLVANLRLPRFLELDGLRGLAAATVPVPIWATPTWT